jgi:hypothetical protein
MNNSEGWLSLLVFIGILYLFAKALIYLFGFPIAVLIMLGLILL